MITLDKTVTVKLLQVLLLFLVKHIRNKNNLDF